MLRAVTMRTRLLGVVAPGGERVEPEAAFVGGGGVLLLGVAVTSVESMSITIGPSGGDCAQTCWRAAARATGIARSSAEVRRELLGVSTCPDRRGSRLRRPRPRRGA